MKEYMTALKSMYVLAYPNEPASSSRYKLIHRFLAGIGNPAVSKWITINAPSCTDDQVIEHAMRVDAAERRYQVEPLTFDQVRQMAKNPYPRQVREMPKCVAGPATIWDTFPVIVR